jgi:hypothetical protein
MFHNEDDLKTRNYTFEEWEIMFALMLNQSHIDACEANTKKEPDSSNGSREI